MLRLPDVQRSTGCTEPAAVAFAAALATGLVGGALRRITVRCDRGTELNGRLAAIPGAGGLAGLDLAAALGAVGGVAARCLDVLGSVSGADVERARELVGQDVVSIAPLPDAQLAIDVVVETERGTGEARLRGAHTNVVALLKNGQPLPCASRRADGPLGAPVALSEALQLAEALDEDDERALLQALDTNLAAALAGGRSFASEEDPARDAEGLAEAASHARMTGMRVAVMTSGWSGNQGLVATLPIAVVARRRDATQREVARALAISLLVGQLLRDRSPSPLCHALVAASAGAAAGCAHLLGGAAKELERACQLVIASAGAPACDGAKPACGLRAGLGAAQAVRCARRAVEDPPPAFQGGLVGDTLEDTARNVNLAAARLAAGGASL